MNVILIAVISLGAIALVAAVILYVASKKFAGFGKGKPLLCRIIKFCVIKEQPSNKTASITAAVPTQRKPAGSICKSAATGQ